MEAAAYGVGFHANANQIIALEAIQGFFSGDSHGLILRFFAKKNICGERGVFTEVFAIYCVFLDSKLWCFAGKNVVNCTMFSTMKFSSLLNFIFRLCG
jgi:hypothetical protein